MPFRAPADFDRTRADRLLVRGVPPTEGRLVERPAWYEARSFNPHRQVELAPINEAPTQIEP